MFCRKCGTELKDSDNFCFNCGTPTVSEEVETIETTKSEADTVIDELLDLNEEETIEENVIWQEAPEEQLVQFDDIVEDVSVEKDIVEEVDDVDVDDKVTDEIIEEEVTTEEIEETAVEDDVVTEDVVVDEVISEDVITDDDVDEAMEENIETDEDNDLTIEDLLEEADKKESEVSQEAKSVDTPEEVEDIDDVPLSEKIDEDDVDDSNEVFDPIKETKLAQEKLAKKQHEKPEIKEVVPEVEKSADIESKFNTNLPDYDDELEEVNYDLNENMDGLTSKITTVLIILLILIIAIVVATFLFQNL